MTVTVEVPTVAEAEAAKVRVVVQVGLQEVGAKEAVTPLGNPEALKDTAAVAPEDKVEVMALVTDDPWTTDLFPPLVIVKSKAGGGGGGGVTVVRLKVLGLAVSKVN